MSLTLLLILGLRYCETVRRYPDPHGTAISTFRAPLNQAYVFPRALSV